MKVCISSSGQTIDSPVDERFGRASCFLTVDTETMQFQVVPNDALNSAQGAGVTAAKTVIDSGAKAVLTGNCGPNAHRILIAADVQVYIGVNGTVKEALDMFKTNSLSMAEAPNIAPHSGMNNQSQ